MKRLILPGARTCTASSVAAIVMIPRYPRLVAGSWRRCGAGDGEEIFDPQLLAARLGVDARPGEHLGGGRRRTAEHAREGLAQHLASLLERRVDEREGRQPLGFGAGLDAPLEADEHRVDVRHR